jgi:GT2 family glycosyltransferase
MLTRHKLLGTIGYMGGIMSLPQPFTFAWGNMLLHTQALCKPGDHIHTDRAEISLHDYARTQLVQRMKGDWLLMLDTDTTFEADFAARLVAALHRYNLEVVTGIYSFKRPPHSPVLYMLNPETGSHEPIRSWLPLDAGKDADVFPVDAAGAGCLLVRRTVFDRIHRELKEEPFARIGTKGEDMSFFRRLKQLDIKTWCAWKVEMTHLAYKGVRTSSDYDSSQFGGREILIPVEGIRA